MSKFMAKITLEASVSYPQNDVGLGHGDSAREALQELWFDCELKIRDEIKPPQEWRIIPTYRLTVLKGEQVILTTFGEAIHGAIDSAIELELKSRKKKLVKYNCIRSKAYRWVDIWDLEKMAASHHEVKFSVDDWSVKVSGDPKFLFKLEDLVEQLFTDVGSTVRGKSKSSKSVSWSLY